MESWICSPALYDWQSEKEALDSKHKFQQAPTRWGDINRCRGFQKASFGTSSGSLPWAADCSMWKRSTDCRFPWCTATACIYTRGQTKKTCCSTRHHTIRTSANTTTSADSCQFYSSAVHGHCPTRWYRNRLWTREPLTKCGRRSFSCPGGLSRIDDWWLTHERSKVSAIRWCRCSQFIQLVCMYVCM